MDAVEFVKYYVEACNLYSDIECCYGCPLEVENDECLFALEPEEAVRRIEEFSKKYNGDFSELYTVKYLMSKRIADGFRGKYAEGWRWVARNHLGELYFYKEKPSVEIIDGNKYYKANGDILHEKYADEFYSYVTENNSPIFIHDLFKCYVTINRNLLD